MQQEPPSNCDSPEESPAHAERGLSLEFCGKAREYFRVWAVNLCLSLLSLGIFSAWAKVRKKRYFYAHTVLDGTPFQYLARPVPILKGRIIATVLFLFYYSGTHFVPSLLPYDLVAAMLLAPWVVMRSLAFNARYTAYRNMTFAFQGRTWDTIKALYALGLIPLLIVGTVFAWWRNYYVMGAAYLAFAAYFPWWYAGLRRFIVNFSEFGSRRGALSLRGLQYFTMYLLAGLIVLAAGVVGSMVAGAAIVGAKLKGPDVVPLVAILFYSGYLIAYAFARSRTINLVWNQTRLGPLRFESTLPTWGLLWLYVSNAAGILVSAGLLIPWAVMRTYRYRADHMRVFLEGELDEFSGSHAATVQAAGAEVGEFFDLDLSL
jgi:uncharacterized membrane protein YjgN (DUF898 family)